MKRDKKRKAETPYEPHIYVVTQVKGSTIITKRLTDGKRICRDKSKFRRLKSRANNTDPNERERVQHQTQVPPAYAQQPPAVAAQRDYKVYKKAIVKSSCSHYRYGPLTA